MSPYLELPLRSLREVCDETAARITDIERRMSAATAEEYDRLEFERAPLLDRLGALEDEIEWRERKRPDAPTHL